MGEHPNPCGGCGWTPAGIHRFEDGRWAVICPHCDRHGKVGNNATHAVQRWNSKNKGRE